MGRKSTTNRSNASEPTGTTIGGTNHWAMTLPLDENGCGTKEPAATDEAAGGQPRRMNRC